MKQQLEKEEKIQWPKEKGNKTNNNLQNTTQKTKDLSNMHTVLLKVHANYLLYVSVVHSYKVMVILKDSQQFCWY